MHLIYHPLTLSKLSDFKQKLFEIKDLETDLFVEVLFLLVSLNQSIDINNLYRILFSFTKLIENYKEEDILNILRSKLLEYLTVKQYKGNKFIKSLSIKDLLEKQHNSENNKNDYKKYILPKQKYNKNNDISILLNECFNTKIFTDNEEIKNKNAKLSSKKQLNFKKILKTKPVIEKIGIFSKLKISEDFIIFDPINNYKENWVLKKPKLINPCSISFIKLFDCKEYVYRHIKQATTVDVTEKIEGILYEEMSDFMEENEGESISSNIESEEEIEEHESDREFIEKDCNHKVRYIKTPSICKFSNSSVKIQLHEKWRDDFLERNLFRGKIITEEINNALVDLKYRNLNIQGVKKEMRNISIKWNIFLNVLQKYYFSLK